MRFITNKFALITLSLTVFLTACDNPFNEITSLDDETVTETELDNIPEEKFVSKLPDSAPIYKVAAEFDYPPFVSKNSYGRVHGYDVDLIRAIGESQGFKVEFNFIPFSEVYAKLESGEFEIAISGIPKLENKNDRFLISQPYLYDYMQIVSPSNKKIADASDLLHKKIGVQDGTILLDMVQEDTEVPAVPRITVFQLFGDMVNNKNDGFVAAKSINSYIAKKFPQQEITMTNFRDDRLEYVFFVNKDKDELLKKINNGLAEVKEDGEYLRINKKWFGNKAEEFMTK